MFMFWSKRAALTRRLLKAKVRGEHETECETQEDTLSRINVQGLTDNLRSEERRRRKTPTTTTTTTTGTTTATTRGQKTLTSSTGSASRGYSVANRFHQSCCGGDYSHDDDDDDAAAAAAAADDSATADDDRDSYNRQNEERCNASRITRCKELLKSLKENQLEMLLNVVESYGADFGSCVLVPRRKVENSRVQGRDEDGRSSSPNLRDKVQDPNCNRHKRCGFANFCNDNRRAPHRHILRSRRHHQASRCSRCVNTHVTELNVDDAVSSGRPDDRKNVENHDNEINLRIVDSRFNIDDLRQEQPAWTPRDLPRLPPAPDTDPNPNNEPSTLRPFRDRCRFNHGKSSSGRNSSSSSSSSSNRTRKRRDSSSNSNGDCNSSSDSSLEQQQFAQHTSPPDDPHLLSCQTWRWPDLANSSELKKLPVCHSPKDPVWVCCNPYHWSRLCKPESPPPPYCLIPDRLRPEDRAPSEISGDYRRCGITTSQQPHSGSLTTNGEGGDEMGQKEWCTLAYWELGGRVGRLYPVEPSTVNVFDSLHDGDGLCLATLAENHVASPAVQRTRSKIGLGVMLSQESDGVWAYNRSASPIFVNSPTLDDPESRTLLVYRVPPGFCLNIFDRAKTIKLPSRCMGSPMSGTFNSGPVDVNSVRISFAKGWGPKYSRQEVTSCPCWLEVLLAPCR